MSSADSLIAGLGGAGNVLEVEGYAGRLRVVVRDQGSVDDAVMRDVGAHAVVRSGPVVQIVVGHRAPELADDLVDAASAGAAPVFGPVSG